MEGQIPNADEVRVEADRDICIGSAICVDTAVGVFELGEDGKVMVVKDHLDEADLEPVEEAVDLCPVRALALAQGRRGLES